jgi:hypothetical protein
VFLVAALGLRSCPRGASPSWETRTAPALAGPTGVSALFLPGLPPYQHAWLPLLLVAAIWRWAGPRHPGGGPAGPDPLAKRARPGDGRGGGGRARHGNRHLHDPESGTQGSLADAPRAAFGVSGESIDADPLVSPCGVLPRESVDPRRPGVGCPGVIPEEAIADDMRAARRRWPTPIFVIRGMVGWSPTWLGGSTMRGPDVPRRGAEIAAAAGGGRSIVNLLPPVPTSSHSALASR